MQGSIVSNFRLFLFTLFSGVILVSCGGGGGNDLPKQADADTKKPKITLITPTPGINTFANNDVIKIDFDEPINTAVKIDTVLITPFESNGIISSNAVALTDVKYTVQNKVLIVEILQTLTAATKYQVIVKKVTDVSNNEMQGECEWEFATKGYTPLSSINSTSIGECGNVTEPSDTTPLTIVSVTPSNSPFLLTTPIIIKFDNAIDSSTLMSGIRLSEKNSQNPVSPFPYSISYDASKYEVTLTPKTNSALAYNTEYILTIASKNSGIKDRSGNALTDDYIFPFKTKLAPGTDTSQPTIIEVLPSNIKPVIAKTAVVSITFSKPMDSTTLKSSIDLYDVSKSPKVSLVFTLEHGINPTIVTLSAKPSNNVLLSPNTKYELVVRNTVKDFLLGKQMQSDYIAKFSTLATPNQWTWMDGSQKAKIPSVFSGTNTPAYPGTREGTVSWKTSKGVVWFFGGRQTGNAWERLNELWEYNPTSKLWLEHSVGGNRTIDSKGNYGTAQNKPSSLIYPGARVGSMSWIDKNDDLWLFGGYGYGSTGQLGSLNDLWKYTTLSKEWTWVDGEKTVNSPGSSIFVAPFNHPPAREGGLTWIDSDGNFWLFGGEINLAGFSDLWKYTPTTNIWKLVSGSINLKNQKGIYTATTSTPVQPGTHSYSAQWVDKLGNFWFFGGYGWSKTSGAQNDLWKYTPPPSTSTTGKGIWKFMGGSTTADALGVYKQNLTPSGLFPGARYGAVSWLDSQGNLWLYGGWRTYPTGAIDYLSDLWKYNISTNIWTWMHGNDKALPIQHPIYGSLGNSTKTTTPGVRFRAVSWIDSDDNLWLFGGAGYWKYLGGYYSGLKNDLWKYTP